MTGRRIGLQRPHTRPSMPPESQSQDSTQQPSIEIRPTIVSSPFIPPLHTVPEASAECSDPPEESFSLASFEPSSLNDGRISSSSVEETGDSGLAWTQSQIKHNERLEIEGKLGEEKEQEKEEEREEEEEPLHDTRGQSEDGVITSPELPSGNLRSPTPPSARNGNPSSRPSSPTTGKDANGSFMPDEAGRGQTIILEETEVDTPEAPTPDQSQNPSSSPQTHSKHLQPSPLSTSNRQLKGITSYSPSKITAKPPIANGSHLRNGRSATTSPLKASISRKSFVIKKKKNESQGSDESQFGKEALLKVPSNPLEMFGNIMKKNSTNNLEVSSSRFQHEDRSSPLTEQEEAAAEEQDDHSVEEAANDQKASEEEDEATDEEMEDTHEDGQEGVNWEQSLPAANDGLTYIDNHHDLLAPTHLHRSDPSSSPPREGNHSNFHRFAQSSSMASQNAGQFSGGLFSDPGEEIGDLPESQHFVPFAATQVVMGVPSSSLIDPLPEHSRHHDALEATQPNETQQNESDGNPDNLPHSPPHLPRQALSRVPSNLSTTSRISVPSHRQLARRPRGDDDSVVSPINFHPPSNLPPTVLPAKSRALPPKPTQSEAIIGPPDSSPFKKTSPIRNSSEPPMLQETFTNSLGAADSNSSKHHQTANEVPQINQDDSAVPVPLNIQFTSPPKSSTSPSKSATPPFRASSPTSPSLNARHRPESPALPPVLEETQTDSPSLPAIPPPKISPKQYTSRNKRKRILSSPVLDDNAGSDKTSSSDEPDDPEDHTYRPIPKIGNKRKSNGSAPAASSSKNPSTPIVSEMISTKRKRKRVIRSSSLSNISSDEGSSSSAAEDPEDNTYQPSLLPIMKVKIEKGKRKDKSSAPSSTMSSRLHMAKRPKTNGQVAKPSATPSIAEPEVFPVLVACLNRYYAGRAIWTGKGYKVDFEDGETKANVKPDKMRKLILRRGDQLEACTESDLPNKFEVSEAWDGKATGVKCCTLEGEKLGRVPFKDFGISVKFIHSAFSDRLFEDPHSKKNLNGIPGPAGERLNGFVTRNSVPRSPVKRTNGHGSLAVSRRSTSPTRSSNKLQGMLLMPTRGFPAPQAALSATIRSQGGKIAATWEELFDRSSPGECGFSRSLAGTPFLILMGEGKEGTIITPKVMVALAKGIPCLSARFIDDIFELNEKPDWRSYLISPGFSNHVEHYMSQVVDVNWGEEGWDAHSASPVRRPLRGKKILFVLPTTKNEGLKRLVPVCAYAMGVEEIQSVPNLKSSETTIQDQRWDYILFDDREYREKDKVKPLPKYLSAEEDRLCNIFWLKQCLIMGSALPPSLDIEKEHDQEKSKDKKK